VGAAGAAASEARAEVFVAGDGNITDPLVGDNVPIDVGNQQLFLNVLGGGARVAVLQNSFQGCCENFDENVSSFYNGQPGITATTIVGTFDAAALNGVDLFVAAIPDDPFTPDEISAMSELLNRGGSIFFLGENFDFGDQNGYINDALTVLGVDISVTGFSLDAGYHTAVGDQIADNAFTTQVTSFTYAAPSSVFIGAGAPLVFAPSGEPIVAVNVAEPGDAVLTSFALFGQIVDRRRKRAGLRCSQGGSV
jgi:hypothetical protein